MNAKFQQLNEKIFLLTKTIEQNKNNIKKFEIAKEEEKNYYDTKENFKPKIENKIPISHGSKIKAKINILEDEYNTKKEDMNAKLEFLINQLDLLRKKIDEVGEDEDNEFKEKLEIVNQLKKNILNDFNENDNKINDMILNSKNSVSTKISEIKNENNFNYNNNIQDMINLNENATKNLFEIDEKILNIKDIEKKENEDLESNICNKFSEFDEQVKKSTIENNQIIMELNKQISSFSHNIVSTFINKEREKREQFELNIFSILEDTTNKL